MSSQQRLHNPNLIFDPNAYWPIVSYGLCKYWHQRNHSVELDWLGDQLCVTCWDADYKSPREKAYIAMIKSKDKLEKKPNDEELQVIYKEAQEVWVTITEDEDPKMKFGGLLDC